MLQACRSFPLPVRFGNLHRVHINTIFEPSLRLANFDIVTTHLTFAHSAILCERPILKTVASHPLACFGVLEFVPELYRYLVIAESEQLLTKAIARLSGPFACQEFDNRFVSGKELVTIAPNTVFGVSLEEDR